MPRSPKINPPKPSLPPASRERKPVGIYIFVYSMIVMLIVSLFSFLLSLPTAAN